MLLLSQCEYCNSCLAPAKWLWQGNMPRKNCLASSEMAVTRQYTPLNGEPDMHWQPTRGKISRAGTSKQRSRLLASGMPCARRKSINEPQRRRRRRRHAPRQQLPHSNVLRRSERRSSRRQQARKQPYYVPLPASNLINSSCRHGRVIGCHLRAYTQECSPHLRTLELRASAMRPGSVSLHVGDSQHGRQLGITLPYCPVCCAGYP